MTRNSKTDFSLPVVGSENVSDGIATAGGRHNLPSIAGKCCKDRIELHMQIYLDGVLRGGGLVLLAVNTLVLII